MRKNLFLGANAEIFKNAQALRYNMTAAETALWASLGINLPGIKFRRQHPLGQYIADFYCHQHKLVIEVDVVSTIYQKLFKTILKNKHF
jgi:cyclase